MEHQLGDPFATEPPVRQSTGRCDHTKSSSKHYLETAFERIVLSKVGLRFTIRTISISREAFVVTPSSGLHHIESISAPAT